MMMNPDKPGTTWLGATSLSTEREVRLEKKDLSDAPTGNVVVKSQFRNPRCFTEVELTNSPLSTKYAKCRTSVRSKYAALFRKAHDRKERARTIGAYNAAKQKIKKLTAQEKKETASKCEPIRKKINKGFGSLYDELVDKFTDNPPKNMNGRAARAKAEAY